MNVDAMSVRAAILGLPSARAWGASVCPSEVARALVPQAWRGLMRPVRKVGFELAAASCTEVTQRGQVVGRGARRPIRLRLRVSRSAPSA
jgi:hypothetical protein